MAAPINIKMTIEPILKKMKNLTKSMINVTELNFSPFLLFSGNKR